VMGDTGIVKFARAAVLEHVGAPLNIRDLEIPSLLPGQVLVKVLFSGVCRSQLMEVRGSRGVDRWLPHLLGHEGSGIVLAVGEGCNKIQPGDDVILGWIKGDGLDAPGAKYVSRGQEINSGPITTFSNYTVVSESRLVKKPQGMPFDVAVLFGCALPTGAGMVLNELIPQVGSSVAVLGLGGIGLGALMAVCSLSCKLVIAVDISDEKLELAKKIGATHLINSSQIDVSEAVMQLEESGLDFCIESAGSVASIELGFSLIRKDGGHLLFASHPPEGETIRLTPHELISGKRISGSWGGGSQPDKDIPHIFQIFRDRDFPLKSLITRRYTLAEINEALNDLEMGRVFRPLIVMEH
jgi:S-(hydroxymethyl)glutathione dehydrogenase/alcohol dehydrogenase